MSDALAPGELTTRIIRASWAGTAAFAAVAIAAVAIDDLEAFALGLDIALFAAGTAVFLWALVVAAGRSRTLEMGIGGLFFLAGSTAPATVKRHLLGSLAAQTILGFATAGAKPFTPMAGGVLVPMFGLALCGLWGAKLGQFGPRHRAPGR